MKTINEDQKDFRNFCAIAFAVLAVPVGVYVAVIYSL
jgi:hypothetical protein